MRVQVPTHAEGPAGSWILSLSKSDDRMFCRTHPGGGGGGGGVE